MLSSRHFSWMCHTIPSIPVVRLRNSSEKLVLISLRDTRICVFISDWLFSYAPDDWACSCKIYHAMLKINIVACELYIRSTFVQSFALHFKRLKRLCLIRPFLVIYAVESSKRERKDCYFQRDGYNSMYSPRLKLWKYLCY